eukprot:11228309-Lingulodinium_polyedra.AAC.3
MSIACREGVLHWSNQTSSRLLLFHNAKLWMCHCQTPLRGSAATVSTDSTVSINSQPVSAAPRYTANKLHGLLPEGGRLPSLWGRIEDRQTDITIRTRILRAAAEVQ